ncbi:hypothetical protein FA242_18960 [Pseudomonas aeruginosa]|nr:hypothetical protein [Pseudomonas aeruginosa]
MAGGASATLAADTWHGTTPGRGPVCHRRRGFLSLAKTSYFRRMAVICFCLLYTSDAADD